MTYTDQEFGTDLIAQLDKGYDPLRIAHWADRVFLNGSYSMAVRKALIDIFTMQEGQEFYIPEAVLRRIAEEFATS